MVLYHLSDFKRQLNLFNYFIIFSEPFTQPIYSSFIFKMVFSLRLYTKKTPQFRLSKVVLKKPDLFVLARMSLIQQF